MHATGMLSSAWCNAPRISNAATIVPPSYRGVAAVTEEEIRNNAFAMPVHNPAYPRPPFRFINREYFIISYETDIDALKAVVPEPLTVDNGTRPLRVHPHAGFVGVRRLHGKRPGHLSARRRGRQCANYHARDVSRRRRPDRRRPRNLGLSEEARFTASLASTARTRCSARSTTARSASRPARWATSIAARYGSRAPQARRHAELSAQGHSARRWLGAHLRTRALLPARRRCARRVGRARRARTASRMRSRRSPICRFSKVVGARHVIANLTLDVGEVAYDYLAPAEALKLAVNQ